MGRIILDTSSILFGLSNRVDVFKGIRAKLDMAPVISKGVVKELTLISRSRKSSSKHAKVALAMINSYGIDIVDNEEYVDKWILRSARRFSGVCTNDIKLKRELRSRGIATYSVSRDGTFR